MLKKIPQKPITVVKGAFGYAHGKNLVGAVEKVLIPSQGGIFTKYLGCNYWYKGYPEEAVLDYIYPAKRVINGLFLLFSNKAIRILGAIVLFVFFLFPKRLKKQAIIGILDYILAITHTVEWKHPFALPTKKYCLCAKEIYRVSEELLLGGIKDQDLLLRYRKIRDIICMILEMDYAYRARFQDIIPEFNKKNLLKSPIEEFEKVFRIFIQREAIDGNAMLPKWRGLKRIVLTLLRVPKIRKLFVKAIFLTDFSQIMRDEADWYFALDRIDYEYGGVPYYERLRIKDELDKKMGNHHYNIDLLNAKEITGSSLG